MSILVAALAAGSLSAGTLEVVTLDPPRHTLAAKDATVTVTFDQPVDPATVDADSFRVFGRWSGPAAGPLTIGGGGTTVTLTPTRPFSAGESVHVNLSHDLASLGGASLRMAGYTWSFAVEVRPTPGDFALVDTLTVLDGGPTPRIYGGLATDLDNDGWLDLSVINEDTADIRVFPNRADGSGLFDPFLTPPSPVGFGASPNEPADFDNDGFADITTGNAFESRVSVLLGRGDGTFDPEAVHVVGAGPKGIAVLDVDGDGDTDIVSANVTADNLNLLRNDGSGTFAVEAPFDAGSEEYALTAGDMNEDGIADLIVGTRAGSSVHVLAGNGDGTFTTVETEAAGVALWMIGVGDVNGDGHLDVASADGFSNSGSIFLGNGDGTLDPPTTIGVAGLTTATDLGDIDGDGDLDWILSAFGGNEWTLYENDGAGNFQLIRTFPAPSNPACAAFFDADNDGALDLALFDEIDNVIQIFHNGEIFADGFESGDTTAWSATVP